MFVVDRFWDEHRILIREAMHLTLVFAGEPGDTAGTADGRNLLEALRRFRERFVSHVTAEERLLLSALRERGAEGRRVAKEYGASLGASAGQVIALLGDAEEALTGGQRRLARRCWEEAVHCLTRRIELEERRYFPVFRVYLVLPPAQFV